MAPRQDPATRSALQDQGALLLHCWPPGWQDAAWTCGAITRRRVIDGAEAWLRLIFG